ncbi:MAG: DUF5026 domain-containing protein [Defluviitaleaceae bacterium]|nr:DUF5026 domain-containing protein [Defluviitaleaceae bacterium]
MALVVNQAVPMFDKNIIARGDLIRIRRANETVLRNGIVTRVEPSQVQILFSNVQNTATSFFTIEAGDVAIGVWEIWWSSDLVTINYNPAANGAGNA